MQIDAIHLAERRDIAIVDVREAQEREFSGGIPGAFSCPLGDLENSVLQRIVGRNQPIAFACSSGKRSAIAAAEAEDLGYVEVFDLRGGLNAWVAAGLPECAALPAGSVEQAQVGNFEQFPRALIACFVAEAVQGHIESAKPQLDVLCTLVLGYVDEEVRGHGGYSATAMQAVVDRTAMLARALGFPLSIIGRNIDHMRSLLATASSMVAHEHA